MFLKLPTGCKPPYEPRSPPPPLPESEQLLNSCSSKSKVTLAEEDVFFISLTLVDPCSLLYELLLDLFHVHLQCAGSLLQVTIINLINDRE